MAPSPPDPRRGGALLALAAAGLLVLGHALAATTLPADPIQVHSNTYRMNLNDGSFTAGDVELHQGTDTLITAKQAKGLDQGEGNSQWDLSGTVHVEYRGVVLDADTAKVIFVNGALTTVHVQGTQAKFSHQQPGTDPLFLGRANTIDYDSSSGDARFAGKTWYSYGRYEATTEALVYNVLNREINIKGDGSVATRTQLTIRPNTSGKRVPSPQPPARGTAP